MMMIGHNILSYFTADDRSIFEEITGNTVEKLYREIARLPANRFKAIFSLEKCLNWPELNQQGLHIFRCMLAERVRDALMRQRNLWDNPIHAEYLKHGVVVRHDFLGLYAFREYQRTRVFRKNTRSELRRMVECCIADGGYSGNMSTQKIYFKDDGDDQWDIHVDTYHPTIKFWFYVNDISYDHGPLHVVPGSHRNTPQKLRWLYECSVIAGNSSHPDYAHRVQLKPDGEAGFSFRVKIGKDASSIMHGLGFEGERSMEGPANTLIIADTSAFHRRGVIKPGLVRETMRGSHRVSPFNSLITRTPSILARLTRSWSQLKW